MEVEVAVLGLLSLTVLMVILNLNLKSSIELKLESVARRVCVPTLNLNLNPWLEAYVFHPSCVAKMYPSSSEVSHLISEGNVGIYSPLKPKGNTD